MLVRLGKVKKETKDTSPSVTLYDGSPFPPFIYWRLSSQ